MAVAVRGAPAILPRLCELVKQPSWDLIVATQDAHPPNHTSFASTHGAEPFELRDIPHPFEPGRTLSQRMWPVHCVADTPGAALDPMLQQALDACKTPVHYVHKGRDPRWDCYSAFAADQYLQFTELAALLHRASPPIHTVVIAGLATDYCVRATAIDAAKFGFHTVVLQDCVAGVDPATTDEAWAAMRAYGVVAAPDVASLCSAGGDAASAAMSSSSFSA